MIALDTNVLVRILTEDDAAQVAKIHKAMEELKTQEPAFVSNVVLIELAWVLLTNYRYTRTGLAEAMETLLRSHDVILENAAATWQAIAAFRGSKVSFADCMIAQAALSAGCEYTLTFDIAAAKLPGMRLLR